MTKRTPYVVPYNEHLKTAGCYRWNFRKFLQLEETSVRLKPSLDLPSGARFFSAHPLGHLLGVAARLSNQAAPSFEIRRTLEIGACVTNVQFYHSSMIERQLHS